MNIETDSWLEITNEFGKLFKGPVGTLQELTAYCERLENEGDITATLASI